MNQKRVHSHVSIIYYVGIGSGVGIARVVDALALSRFVQSAAAVILEVIEEDLDVSARMNINISFTGSGINGLSVTRVRRYQKSV